MKRSRAPFDDGHELAERDELARRRRGRSSRGGPRGSERCARSSRRTIGTALAGGVVVEEAGLRPARARSRSVLHDDLGRDAARASPSRGRRRARPSGPASSTSQSTSTTPGVDSKISRTCLASAMRRVEVRPVDLGDHRREDRRPGRHLGHLDVRAEALRGRREQVPDLLGDRVAVACRARPWARG